MDDVFIRYFFVLGTQINGGNAQVFGYRCKRKAGVFEVFPDVFVGPADDRMARGHVRAVFD